MRDEGIKDRFIDASILSQPIKTHLHTYEKYLEVSSMYQLAISPFRSYDLDLPITSTANDYLDGYADGFDMWLYYLAANGQREYVEGLRDYADDHN